VTARIETGRIVLREVTVLEDGVPGVAGFPSTLACMTTRSGSVTRALTDLGGVARRADLQVTRGELDAAVRRRQVVRLLPMVYALAARASDPELGERAAVLHAGEVRR
jgi:hypothetical protein